MRILDVIIKLFTNDGKKEANYGGYVELHTNVKFSKHKGVLKNKDEILFPECTSGKSAIDYVEIYFPDGNVHKAKLPYTAYISECLAPVFQKGDLKIKVD